MQDSASPSDVPSKLFDTIMSSVRTAVVVEIQSYDPDPNTAEVTPLVLEERVLDNQRVEIPSVTYSGCPVIFPSKIRFNLEPGQKALALFRHRSHDEIDAGSDGIILPSATRRMNEADMVILAGFFPPEGQHDPQSYRSDGQPVMRLDPGEAFFIGSQSAQFVVVRWDLLQAYLAQIVAAYALHTHLDPVSGSTGTPSNSLPTADDLSSSALKLFS